MAGTYARLRLRNQAHELVLLRVERAIQRFELLFQTGAGGKKRGFPRLRELALLIHLSHGLGYLRELFVHAVILIEKEIDFQVFELVPQA